MPKKLALFLLGVALTIGAFLLYQYLSGSSMTTPVRKATVTTRPTPTTLPMGIESRNEKGELEYLLSATRAEQIKDKDGNPVPGQFKLIRPVATFFDEKNGRTMEIKADECNIIIDQGLTARPAPGANTNNNTLVPGGAGGGKAAEKLMASLRLGQLKGHVRLTVAARPGDALAPATQGAGRSDLERAFADGELTIHFDGDLEFDGTQEILSSPGKIFIRSDLVAFDGEGLTLAFNREARRVEFLRIEKGNTIIIRKVGARALALADNTADTRPAIAAAPKPPAVPARPLPPAPAAPLPAAPAAASKPAFPPTSYKLSFGQDVRCSVGDSVMTSDHLYLLFMIAREAAAKKAAPGPLPAADPLADPIAGAPAAPPAPAKPDLKITTGDDAQRPGPMPEPGVDDLVVHWTGPMEMRPAGEQDLQLESGKDIALEAVGTAAKPVEVTVKPSERNATGYQARAGRLWFHQAEQRLKLEPDAFARVELTSAAQGRLVCRELSYFQKDNRAELIGPGTLEAQTANRPNSPLTTVAWKERLNLELAQIPDAKKPGKTTLALRRAIISGTTIKNETFDLSADLLDILVASSADAKQPALEHLLATGNVAVNSYKRDKAIIPSGGPSDGLRAKSLEIKTTKVGNLPVPSQLIAEGDASGWQFFARNKNADPKDPALLEKRMVTTARLVADLKPRTRASNAPDDSALGGMGQDFDVAHFLADAGVKIEITPPSTSKNAPIVVTAHKLDADPVANTATLDADPADPKALVEIAMGTANGAKARRILLDQSKETFTVPGSGQFTFTPPEKDPAKKPTPMEITWADRMSFDNKAKLALFFGKPVAKIAGERADLGQLAAEKSLKVQLKAKDAATPATAPANASFADSGGMELDYIETDGHVDARGAQLAADGSGSILRQLRLNTNEKLTFRGNAFSIAGPGNLVIDNNAPETPGERANVAGQFAFKWQGGLAFNSDTSAIAFTKDVQFLFLPKKPFKLPSGGMAGDGANQAQGKEVYLLTNRLTATLIKTKGSAKTVASPLALGSGGKMDLEKVRADNGAQLKLGDFELNGGSLEFNVPTNTATVEAQGDDPAVAIRPGQAILMADQITWDLTKDNNAFSIKGPRGNIQQ